MTKFMKTIILTALLLSSALASALDFAATPQTAWSQWVGTPPPAHITDARLREAINWRVLGGPVPVRLGATPYGIQMKKWDATISNFGLPAVAEEYVDFLHRLQTALERSKNRHR